MQRKTNSHQDGASAATPPRRGVATHHDDNTTDSSFSSSTRRAEVPHISAASSASGKAGRAAVRALHRCGDSEFPPQRKTSSAELLGRLIHVDQLTDAGEVAAWCGVSRRTVNYWTAGQVNMPAEAWREVLVHLPDQIAIAHLIVPEDLFGIVELPSAALLASAGRTATAKLHGILASAIGHDANWTRDLLAVIRDGRVDETDRKWIDQMRKQLPELICALLTAQHLVERLLADRSPAATPVFTPTTPNQQKQRSTEL